MYRTNTAHHRGIMSTPAGHESDPVDLIYEMQQPSVLSKYRIWPRPGSSSQSSSSWKLAPKSWKLYGSNDNWTNPPDTMLWTELDAQSDITAWTSVTECTSAPWCTIADRLSDANTYTVTSSTAFLYYRLAITKCSNSQTDYQQLALSEWALYGTVVGLLCHPHSAT